jgi:hypothetical protein
MINTNCKNCGAPIRHLYSHKCEYCGTYQQLSIEYDELKDLRDFEIEDVKIEIRRSMFRNEYELILTGTAIPKHQWFYEDGGEYCTFRVTNVTPIGIRVCIEADTYCRAKYSQEGIERLRKIIEMSIPPNIREQPKVEEAIFKKLHEMAYSFD